MFNTTNVIKTFSYYGDALYQSLPTATDFINEEKLQNIGDTIRQNLPKDPTALVLIAAGVALYGLSRFLAAPSKQQEEEVLELERVETPKQQAKRTVAMSPDRLAIRMNGPLSAEQFQDIERIIRQWQMENCTYPCDFNFPMVIFPVLAG